MVVAVWPVDAQEALFWYTYQNHRKRCSIWWKRPFLTLPVRSRLEKFGLSETHNRVWALMFGIRRTKWMKLDLRVIVRTQWHVWPSPEQIGPISVRMCSNKVFRLWIIKTYFVVINLLHYTVTADICLFLLLLTGENTYKIHCLRCDCVGKVSSHDEQVVWGKRLQQCVSGWIQTCHCTKNWQVLMSFKCTVKITVFDNRYSKAFSSQHWARTILCVCVFVCLCAMKVSRNLKFGCVT